MNEWNLRDHTNNIFQIVLLHNDPFTYNIMFKDVSNFLNTKSTVITANFKTHIKNDNSS